ncbi:MAG: acetyltransferase [Bacteroidia bacterium]|nr:acetyltransferase [Bacteroidota bacterium]MBP8074319.1 acetyltransferase [Bacteroidia bacterium]
MKKLVIVGSGGFAREVLWLIEDINKSAGGSDMPYAVLGFISTDAVSHIQGLPVLGDDAWVFENLDPSVRFVLAVGDSTLRAKLALDYQQHGLHPLRLVHPSVVMSDEVQLGGGAIVCAGAVLTVNIQIGAFCVVNLNSTIGHDCRLGDFVTLHPGVHLSGGAEVGDLSILGTGAVVLPGIKIGDHSIVGAGAVVTEDLEGNATYMGIPARESK